MHIYISNIIGFMYSSLTVISCRVINWYNVNISSILDLYNISVSEWEWESDQNQNELYWTGIFTHIVIEASQRNRMTVTGYTNIQLGNVQNGKNTIYNTDSYVWGLTCKFEMKKISVFGE